MRLDWKKMVCYQVDILAIFARILPNRLELLLLGWKSSTGARLSSRTESTGQELLRGGRPSSKGKGNFPFCIFTTTVLKKKLHYVCCTKMSKPCHAISSFPYCNPHSGQTNACLKGLKPRSFGAATIQRQLSSSRCHMHWVSIWPVSCHTLNSLKFPLGKRWSDEQSI